MMFFTQVVATIITSFVVLGVQAWQAENIVDFCQPDNKREVYIDYDLSVETQVIPYRTIHLPEP